MELEEQQIGAVLHCSRRIYCTARRQTALASIVERTDTNGAVRFVLWCSLRSAGECDEQCLRREQRDGQPQATTGYGKRIVIPSGEDANASSAPHASLVSGNGRMGLSQLRSEHEGDPRRSDRSSTVSGFERMS